MMWTFKLIPFSVRAFLLAMLKLAVPLEWCNEIFSGDLYLNYAAGVDNFLLFLPIHRSDSSFSYEFMKTLMVQHKRRYFIYLATDKVILATKKKTNNYYKFQALAKKDPKFLNDFVMNPTRTLKKAGITVNDLKCPDEVHKSIEKAETICKKIESLGAITPAILPKAASIVEETFGSDYVVSVLPFGVQFSVKAKTRENISFTGTIRITWREDSTDTD